MSGEPDDAMLIDLLEDEYVRAILTETSAEPMSATTLSERCDASDSTIYRRLERLREHGLIEERVRPNPDGNHYRVFASTVDRFEVAFEDGDLFVDVEQRDAHPDDAADRFTKMWEDL